MGVFPREVSWPFSVSSGVPTPTPTPTTTRTTTTTTPSEAWCFPPGRRWFFRSCFTAAPAGNRSCRKMLFFQNFRRHVRQFFGVVLELARPSEAWGFPPGGKLAFQRFEWYPYTNTNTNNNNTFRGMVFSAREEVIFFEAVLLPHPQATEAVEKCCFSRISDDTLGSFWRGFGTSSSFRSMGFSPGR